MTEAEYQAALAACIKLAEVDPPRESRLGQCLLLLATECSMYELEHHSFQNPYRNAPS